MKHLHGTGDLASNGLRRSDILAENRIGARIGRRGAMLASVVVMMAAAGLLAGSHWLPAFLIGSDLPSSSPLVSRRRAGCCWVGPERCRRAGRRDSPDSEWCQKRPLGSTSGGIATAD